MKKILTFIIALTCLVSCYTDEDKAQLQKECHGLVTEISTLKEKKEALYHEVSELRCERKAYAAGREPRYIVKFKIKQGTFTLDPFEHIKNEMNAIEVEVPVTRDYYNRLKIGQDLTDAFKWGSLVMDGDFSNLHMRVEGKRIE